MFSIPRYPIDQIKAFPVYTADTPVLELVKIGANLLAEYGDLVATLHSDVSERLKTGTPAARRWAIGQVREARKNALEEAYYAEFAAARDAAMEEPAVAHMTWAHDVLAYVKPEKGMPEESRKALLETLVSVRNALLDIERETTSSDSTGPNRGGAGSRGKSVAKKRTRSEEDRARTQRTKGDTAAKPLHPHAK